MAFESLAQAEQWLRSVDGSISGPVQKGDFREWTARSRRLPTLTRMGYSNTGPAGDAQAKVDAITMLHEAMGTLARP